MSIRTEALCINMFFHFSLEALNRHEEKQWVLDPKSKIFRFCESPRIEFLKIVSLSFDLSHQSEQFFLANSLT